MSRPDSDERRPGQDGAENALGGASSNNDDTSAPTDMAITGPDIAGLTVEEVTARFGDEAVEAAVSAGYYIGEKGLIESPVNTISTWDSEGGVTTRPLGAEVAVEAEFYADVFGNGGLHSLSAAAPGQKFETFGCYKGSELYRRATAFKDRGNVWVGALPLKHAPERGKRGTRHHVAYERWWLFADLDWKHHVHKDSYRLPTAEAARRAIGMFAPAPTWVVNTGHGLQCYWKLDRAVDPDEWSLAARGLKKQLQSADLFVERTTDSASVMRAPGSVNIKDPNDPKLVTVLEMTGASHSPKLFTATTPTPRAKRKPTAKKSAPTTKAGIWLDIAIETPADFIRRDGDGQTLVELLEDAGCEIGADMGDFGIDVKRPGKKEDGTSARVHTNDDGSQYVNLFSTGFPEAWYEVGAEGGGEEQDGDSPVERVLTKWDLVVAERYDGDAEEAARDTRRRMNVAAASAPVGNIPAEFYDARPILGQIRDAARTRMVAPDAVLGVVLARYSTMVPPSFKIPPIIGTTATFDHMTVLVSSSGGGKSGALGVGRELLPAPDNDCSAWDVPVGSGEGLLEAFFTNVKVGKGDKTEKKRTKSAVLFVADEAKGFVETSNRSGSTASSVLCSAWSGQTLGQANASKETHRVIPAGEVRISGVMGVQTSLGHILMTESLVEQGLTGRLMFFSAIDPDMPKHEDAPEWPGQLDLKPPLRPHSETSLEADRKYWETLDAPTTELTYPDEVENEVRTARHAVVTGQLLEDPVEGHRRLARMKIAGLLALVDDRIDVSLEDWLLAEMVVETSRRLRQSMVAAGKAQQAQSLKARAVADGERRVISDELVHRTDVAKAAGWVRDRVRKVGKQTRAQLVRSMSRRYRSALDEGIESAEANGWVTVRTEATSTGSDTHIVSPA